MRFFRNIHILAEISVQGLLEQLSSYSYVHSWLELLISQLLNHYLIHLGLDSPMNYAHPRLLIA